MEYGCKRNANTGRCYTIILYLIYLALFISIFVADRISKSFALNNFGISNGDFNTSYIINKFLYFQLTFNKGVSWGLFNWQNETIFLIVTSLVILITLLLILYTIYRANRGYLIFGELLVIVGSLSNIVDRFLYGNVIDFIVVHINDWNFPVFNLADSAICLGVFIMFYQSFIKTK